LTSSATCFGSALLDWTLRSPTVTVPMLTPGGLERVGSVGAVADGSQFPFLSLVRPYFL
jgi:hypothetical protein